MALITDDNDNLVDLPDIADVLAHAIYCDKCNEWFDGRQIDQLCEHFKAMLDQ